MYTQPHITAARRLILSMTLVIVGLWLVGVFGMRAYHAYARLQPRGLPTGTTDVAAIRGWMTVPYIARTYRVPEDTLFAALGIPKAGNERLSLNGLARKYARDPLAIRQAIALAILRYQRTAPPGSRGVP
jgi:hypothetical protein